MFESLEAYLGLFFISFIAATLLPAASEVMLMGLFSSGYDPFMLWLVATSGNTLGSVINYALGRYLLHFEERRWFPFKQDSLGRSQLWFQKYGVWSLLFAWAPIFGDALTFIAGIMKVRFWLFFSLTAVGKGTRYAVLLGLVELFIHTN